MISKGLTIRLIRRRPGQWLNMELSQTNKEFCNLRNYIFTYLLMNNTIKSGGVSNMTFGEFDKAQYSIKESSYVVFVKEHITMATCSYCMLPFIEELYKVSRRFLAMRKALHDVNMLSSSSLITSWNGKK